MKAADRMTLRECRVELEEHHLFLSPAALPLGRRRDPVTVAYRDVADIAIVDPIDGSSRALMLRLVDGTTITTPFAQRSTLKMRRIQHQAWKRVRAAKSGSAK
jgi:hypothetical protein